MIPRVGQSEHKIPHVQLRVPDLAVLGGLCGIIITHLFQKVFTQFTARYISIRRAAVRFALQGPDQGRSKDAAGGHFLVGAASGDELPDRLGGFGPYMRGVGRDLALNTVPEKQESNKNRECLASISRAQARIWVMGRALRRKPSQSTEGLGASEGTR